MACRVRRSAERRKVKSIHCTLVAGDLKLIGEHEQEHDHQCDRQGILELSRPEMGNGMQCQGDQPDTRRAKVSFIEGLQGTSS